MAQTSSSSIWDSLGSGALAAGLSYAQSRGIDVANNNDPMTNPDITSQYYGYGNAAADQSTVGAGTSSGMSTALIVGAVLLVGVVAFALLKR